MTTVGSPPGPAASEPVAGPPAPGAVRGRTPRRTAIVVAAVLLGLVIAVSLLAPLLAPADPNAQELTDRFAPPSAEHWLGTDDLGRDVLSRLLYAGRPSLLASTIAVATAVVLSVAPGLVAGYARGRWLDSALNLVSDAFMSVPALVLAVGILTVTGPGLTNAMVAVGVVFAPRLFRLVRAVAQEAAAERFVTAGRAMGASDTRLLVQHVAPQVVAPLAVQVAILFGEALLAEAGLSFLGLGATPPTASWGTMLRDGVRYLATERQLVIAPGLVITVTVFAFMLMGEGIRDRWTIRRGNRG